MSKPARSEADQVIVIGSGFAGLSAAVRLAAVGVRVLVLEARGRMGGRATAYVDKSTGEEVDNGQHVVAGCYRETFDFLRIIGAESRLHVQTMLEVPFIDESGRVSRLRCPSLPSPLHLVAGVMRWNGVGWRDRAALVRLGGVLRQLPKVLKHEGADALGRFVQPGESVDTWLARHGQPERLRRMLWEPLAVAALNQDVRIASATPFLRVLAEMFGPDPRAAALGMPLVPLDQMYADPARKFIESHGGSVRTNALAHVIVERGVLKGVDIRGEFLPATTVIAAVPWFALPNTIRDDSGALQALLGVTAKMSTSPIVTVNVWFDRPVIDDLFVGLPGRVMQWVFDKKKIWRTANAPAHLSLVSSGAEAVLRRTNDELIQLAIDELRTALPAARDAQLLRATVVREPQATFSLAPDQPKRPENATAVPGLLVAGDWTNTGFPATIESAVLSGRTAAAAIKTPHPQPLSPDGSAGRGEGFFLRGESPSRAPSTASHPPDDEQRASDSSRHSGARQPASRRRTTNTDRAACRAAPAPSQPASGPFRRQGRIDRLSSHRPLGGSKARGDSAWRVDGE